MARIAIYNLIEVYILGMKLTDEGVIGRREGVIGRREGVIGRHEGVVGW